MKRNVAGQSAVAQMSLAADNLPFTGAASVLVLKDNGTLTAGVGTAPAHEGNGAHSYTPTQAETDADHVAFIFTGALAKNRMVQFHPTFPQSGDSFSRIGVAGAGLTDVSLNADQSGVTIGTVNNVTGLVAGSGGISVAASSFVLTTGGTPVNDFSNTIEKDGVHHIIPPSAGNTDGYYGFNIGPSGVPQTVTWVGYAQGNGDSYNIYAYNFATTSYHQIDELTASNGTNEMTETFELLSSHVGSGAQAGEVRLRFVSSDGSNFATDRIFCTLTEATSGIPNGSTITLSAPATNQTFSGHNWSMDFSGETISGAYLSQATSVVGTGVIANGNSVTLQQCILQAVSLDAFFVLEGCDLGDTLTLTSTSGGVDDFVLIKNGSSAVSGILTPTVDASAITKTLNLQSRKWGGGCAYIINAFTTLSHETTVGGAVNLTNAGGMAEIRGEITNITVASSLAATTNITISSGGPIVVNGDSGTVNVFGLHGGITDNSGGTVTINDLGIDMIAIQNVTNSISIFSGLAVSSTTNTITLPAGASSTDGAYDPARITIVAGKGQGQTRLAVQYDGTSKILAVDRDWKEQPDGTSVFTINSDIGREHVNEGLARGGSTNKIILNALASSDSTAYVGQICFIRSGLGGDQSGTGIAYNGSTKELTIDKNWGTVPDATSGYAMLPASPVLLTDSTKSELVTNILTTQMTESYSAAGAAPTLAQSLFSIQQFQQEHGSAGTTKTVKKIDGITTAMLFTYDDGDNPNGLTRST